MWFFVSRNSTERLTVSSGCTHNCNPITAQVDQILHRILILTCDFSIAVVSKVPLVCDITTLISNPNEHQTHRAKRIQRDLSLLKYFGPASRMRIDVHGVLRFYARIIAREVRSNNILVSRDIKEALAQFKGFIKSIAIAIGKHQTAI